MVPGRFTIASLLTPWSRRRNHRAAQGLALLRRSSHTHGWRVFEERPRRSTLVDKIREHPYATASAVGGGGLAASALVNRELAAKAERDNPARGRFVEVDGVRLHYVERGSGEPSCCCMATAA